MSVSRTSRRPRRGSPARGGPHGAFRGALRGVLCCALCCALLSPLGCIVVNDNSGVALSDEQVAQIVPGVTTRDEALELLGPPTGIYSTSLRAIVTGMGSTIDETGAPPRVDEDVLTWQAIAVRVRIAFVPVIFARVRGRITDRTLTLFFDERGVVRHAAWRDGTP